MYAEAARLLKERVDQLFSRITAAILVDSVPLTAEFRRSTDPVPYARRTEGVFQPAQEGDQWGETWESAWFHLRGCVPQAWAGRCVVAHLDFNGEGLVYEGQEDTPLQGITTNSVLRARATRDVVRLFPVAQGGEAVELWVETAANGLFGIEFDDDPPRDCPQRHGHYTGKVNKIRLCIFNETMFHLAMDVEVLKGQLDCLPESSVHRARLLRVLNDALNVYAGEADNVARCRAILAPELARSAHASDLQASAVGHAHIDIGWLWRVRESRRKAARTFSTQLRLLEQYPDYIFGASQPQLYQFVKDHYPKLYANIQQAVRAGRWEVQGGMWVEADCNLISGESMVRQFLHGKNFFRDEFGVEVNHLWLPDVFGYSAAMPQILRRSGCEFFVTQKLSWSQYNQFPHHTFNWRGIDGTTVITHFPPENNYNSTLEPKSLAAGQQRFQERDLLPAFLSLFGVGDGGGGPTERDIERGRRQHNLEGAPKVTFAPAQQFLDSLRPWQAQLETWNGELYLERHRGTFTSQARTKLGNRQLENRLRQTEALCSCLPLEHYPAADLDVTWKTVLCNQFHDILPGSSINAVYLDTQADHDRARETCATLQQAAAAKLFNQDATALVLFNCLSHACTEVFELPAAWGGCGVTDDAGVQIPVQYEAGRSLALVTLPAQAFVSLHKDVTAVNPTRNAISAQNLTLENSRVRYEFSPSGHLVAATDLELNRPILTPGQVGNLLSLYEDQPCCCDAWDIDLTYEQQRLAIVTAQQALRLADGPVRQALSFEYRYGDSSIVQTVSLVTSSKRLDFHTRVDWHERHRMLRVSFPVAVLSDAASFDIQYGHVRRPTHRNTSWDMARFESVAHRYADLSEPDFGVALLNDCKYGYKVLDNVLDLNLLRAPTNPDPDADQGVHEMTYSLFPHSGGPAASEVQHQGAALNLPPVLFSGYRAAPELQFPCRLVFEDGVSLEVVKKAEKEACHVIRLVETCGKHSCATLVFAAARVHLVETNLLEWSNGPVQEVSGSVRITLAPFEIRTYKLITVASL